mmetsp:Transcript_40799/g.75507  ORF Transcript_40799/g.75507 Transcript_40799/m.75507 type:complete len:287 (-) Transcript_40799:238-1098(-)
MVEPTRSRITTIVKTRKRGRGGMASFAVAFLAFGSHQQHRRAAATTGSRTYLGENRAAQASDSRRSPAPEQARSRRRLLTDDEDDIGNIPPTTFTSSICCLTFDPADSAQKPEEKHQHIAIIKSKLGQHKHHGTGNPLALRSPTTPKTMAVDNLAAIICSGHLGQDSSNLSGSIAQLKTERGTASEGSFWATAIELAGRYGWTGLILPPNTDTSEKLPISKVEWFLLETGEERERLEKLLRDPAEQEHTEGGNDSERRHTNALGCKWDEVKDRVVVLKQLADTLSN